MNQADRKRGAPALPRWPLFLIAAPAAVAVWSGWVGLGGLCGFGIIHPLPGIWEAFKLNTAITLPIGVEAYGAYALGAWLTPGATRASRQFARRSAIGALVLGMAGQVIYHLLSAAHSTRAPWPVVTLVSCLPVVSLALGAALAHLLRAEPDRGSRSGTGPGRAAPEPDRELVPDLGGPPGLDRATTGAPVPDRAASVRAARPALPARVPSPVLDRTGLEHARAAYRASVTAGAPLSGRALADRHGISRRQAARIIGEADGAPALSVVGDQP